MMYLSHNFSQYYGDFDLFVAKNSNVILIFLNYNVFKDRKIEAIYIKRLL